MRRPIQHARFRQAFVQIEFEWREAVFQVGNRYFSIGARRNAERSFVTRDAIGRAAKGANVVAQQIETFRRADEEAFRAVAMQRREFGDHCRIQRQKPLIQRLLLFVNQAMIELHLGQQDFARQIRIQNRLPDARRAQSLQRFHRFIAHGQHEKTASVRREFR